LQETPFLRASDFASLRIDDVVQAAHNPDIGMIFKDLKLALKALGKGPIIRVRPSDQWSSGFTRDAFRAQRRSEICRPLDQTNSGVDLHPLPEALSRPIGRRIIQDDELEILKCLAEDTFYRDVEIGHRIVNRHDDAEGWGLVS